MEFEAPWAPTLPSLRAAAVQAYVEGERLCDTGEHAAGIRKLREAGRQAWELEQEEWPGWAVALHAALTTGTYQPEHAPPLIGLSTKAWQPELADQDEGIAGTWWREAEATGRIAAVLDVRGVVLVDGFAGEALLSRVRGECQRACDDGILRPARVRTADDGPVQGSTTQRGDHIAWASEDGQRWESVRELARQIDSLVCSLRLVCGGEVASIESRMLPMVAQYGTGAAFARHADNHCMRGRGAHCDCRVLTAVYYISSTDWCPETDGGCLRIYRPYAAGARVSNRSPHRVASRAVYGLLGHTFGTAARPFV